MAFTASRTVASLRTAAPSVSSLKQTPAKAFAKAALRQRATTQVARFSVVAREGRSGYETPMWYIGADAPSYLDGTLPGDYGFDPLGLGSDPERLKWYVEAELVHGRWAMIAVAGILGAGFLGVEGQWYEQGAKDFDFPFLPLLGCQALVMGFIETKRLEGFKATGETGFVGSYPFDPAGMKSDSMKLKEVKNGRLAMLAITGFYVQALVTRTGPLDNLAAHLADPAGANITTSVGNIQNVL
eukprot:gene14409-17039_t